MSPELTDSDRRLLRRFKAGAYVIPAGETRPTPVVPSKPPFPVTHPTDADREGARRFLAFKETEGRGLDG